MPKHMSSGPGAKRVPVAPVVVVAAALVAVAVGVFVFVGQGMPASNAGSASATASDVQMAGEMPVGTSAEGNDSKETRKEGTEVASGNYKSEVARQFAIGEVHSVRLIGDSITAGYGTDGYDEAVQTVDTDVIYSDESGDTQFETPASVNCWANAFRTYAKDHGVQKFVNAGINGALMNRLSDHPNEWLDDGADVVFVALGTNDAGYYGPDEFRTTAQRGLAAAAQKSKLLVVLSPVRDLRPDYMLVEPASDLGDILRDICESEGYLFVDPRDYVQPSMFNTDGLHPNSTGSLAIWDCVRETLGLKS